MLLFVFFRSAGPGSGGEPKWLVPRKPVEESSALAGPGPRLQHRWVTENLIWWGQIKVIQPSIFHIFSGSRPWCPLRDSPLNHYFTTIVKGFVCPHYPIELCCRGPIAHGRVVQIVPRWAARLTALYEPLWLGQNREAGDSPWSQACKVSTQVSAWWPGLHPLGLVRLSPKKQHETTAIMWTQHPQGRH